MSAPPPLADAEPPRPAEAGSPASGLAALDAGADAGERAAESDDADEATWGERSAVFELPGGHAAEPPGAAEVTDVGHLFRNYRAYVAKIGRRILGPSSDVDDLIQDVFLATVRDAHKIKDPARLGAWLGTVTTRMAKRRRFRSSAHPVTCEDIDAVLDHDVDAGPGPESTADLAGNIEKLLSLPDDLRTPWLLKHVEGHTLEDVARRCDCSMSTAARRIQMVSQKLHKP